MNIQEGVTSIGNSAFSGCSSLTNIIIPEGITSIDWYTFRNCSSLKSINIPEGVTSIGQEAFKGCTSLENIVIPEGVKSIGDRIFDGCSSLESINVDINNKNYASENGVLFNKEKTEIIIYPAGKEDIEEYMIPNTVTSIEADAFANCISLKSINIPEGITNIADSTFEGCSSLESITIPESITSIRTNAFSGCSSLDNIIIPEGVKSIEDMTFYGCSSLKSITIPVSVTSIGSNAFTGCSSLDNIIIPEGVKSIEENAISDKTIIFTKSNSEGHRYAEEGEQGYIIDDVASTVTFIPNTGENIQKEHSVKIQVQDNMEEVGVNENSLKYQWTQSETEPAKESFIESFENGQTITKNTGDGVWYLWVYVKDNVGNETITRSEAFNFDNTAPVLNVTYSTKNPTNENVTVTITSNEEIQEIEGWTLSSDKKVLTKEYDENTKETITVKDLAGNETQANIEITNIDKTLPEITIGDINKDEKIDVTDLLMLKRHLVAGSRENWKLTGDNLLAADMNEDGNIDITDMLMLKRIIVEDM